MGILDELMKEHCPYGVERAKLLDVADVLYGYPCDASKFNDDKNGTPLIRIRDVLSGCTDTYTTETVPCEYIIKNGDLLVGMDGNFHVGNWKSEDAFLCQRVCKIYPKQALNKITNGYLSHLLGPIIKNIENGKQSGTVKHLLAKDINSIEIPVPPLPVQEEIVRILDKFTELEAELEAELARRKQQYAFYRDRLLSFDSPIVTKTIGEICAIKRGKVISKDYIREHSGVYPVYSSQTENDGELGLIDSYDYDGEYLTWTTDGANAGTVFHRTGKFNITNVCGLLKPIDANVNPRYLYYILGNIAGKYVEKGMGNPKLMSNVMEKIKVPIPSLDIQQRLVNVLDNFDVICSDLSIGLPAEISARQKQYEYYRDFLLEYAANGLNFSRAQQSTAEHSRAQQSTAEHSRAQQSSN